LLQRSWVEEASKVESQNWGLEYLAGKCLSCIRSLLHCEAHVDPDLVANSFAWNWLIGKVNEVACTASLKCKLRPNLHFFWHCDQQSRPSPYVSIRFNIKMVRWRVITNSRINWRYLEICNVADDKIVIWKSVCAFIHRLVLASYCLNFEGTTKNCAFGSWVNNWIDCKREGLQWYHLSVWKLVNFNWICHIIWVTDVTTILKTDYTSTIGNYIEVIGENYSHTISRVNWCYCIHCNCIVLW
jgi:hypothetical protein